MTKRNPPSGNDDGPKVAILPSSPRELVVMAKPTARLQATDAGVASDDASLDVSPLNEMLAKEGIQMTPLFGLSEERMRGRMKEMEQESGEPAPDLSIFYHVEAPEEALDDLVNQFQKFEAIEAAYVKPPSEPPVWVGDDEEIVITDLEPTGEGTPATPDFSASQFYLNAAPEGIDARHAWTLPGGRGTGVQIIDCEWGWNFTHEDLTQNSLGILVGAGSANDNHGTAVVGEIGGDRIAFGVTGIAPDAKVGAAAFSMPSATTIRLAADRLGPGDIILLEIHRPGPNATGSGQFGFIAIEWWPDDFAAIRYAVNRGIIVVEAAGNGAQDLDAAVYNTRPAGFPATWRNPFNPANSSSQAVVVGAGAPPPGTHGRNHGPDRSRLGFSNYGRRVDCQGWGERSPPQDMEICKADLGMSGIRRLSAAHRAHRQS